MSVRNVFMGPQRLRAGWGVLLFVAFTLALRAVIGGAVTAAHVNVPDGFSPGVLAASDGLTFVLVLLVTLLVGRIERRTLAACGLPWRGALRPGFWVGLLWGLAAVAAIVAPVAAMGGVHWDGLRYHGGELARMTLLWALAMLAVGLAEELFFRGYMLRALADGIGFWPGAVVLSLAFGAIHFFFKPHETLVDFASVGLIGLFFCFALRRTGDLWWPIGFHAGFDLAQLGLFAGPNSGNAGQPVAQALLVPHWTGPAWMTGGSLGIEASAFVFPVIALLYVSFARVYRTTNFPPAEN